MSSRHTYALYVKDHTYSSWKLQCKEDHEHTGVKRVKPLRGSEHFLDSLSTEDINDLENETCLNCIDPLQQRYFHEDTFSLSCLPGTPMIPQFIHSPIRQATHLSGVLILEGNKTYGRNANKKRLLYRVIPEQKQLPHFLVPYEIKPSFHKAFTNKYVLFRFDQWNDSHPHGLLTEVLGNVDQLDAYYEYQLYSKHLNGSIKEMTKLTEGWMKKQSLDSYMDDIFRDSRYNIKDHTHITTIFTIDSPTTSDFDDALNLTTTNEGTIVTVYLANVTLWLERFELWNAFNNRVSSVYLPDRRRPMLPTLLSEELCSLRANQQRFALAIDFHFTMNTFSHITFHLTKIRVAHNYVYDDPQLQRDDTYQALLRQSPSHITNSHDLVAHWMIEANKTCAGYLMNHNMGIFRTVKSSIDHVVPSNVATDTVIQHWISCSGQYEMYHDQLNNGSHLFLHHVYAQVTSPIRRLVDLLNQTMIIAHMQAFHSEGACAFVSHWTSKLDYINTSMRSIRKLQTACSLLHQCTVHPEIMEDTHEGIVFDKLRKANGLFGYMVYLDKLKLLSKVTTTVDVNNHSRHQFRIYLFESELHTKKKIRVSFTLSSSTDLSSELEVIKG